ncbi:MAG TPA: hypothetical protein VGN86_12790, partial [Pyrinomonadaceae bacterium]|nr:hypothetical protein [Pyrinomonadaceae bacterium]
MQRRNFIVSSIACIATASISHEKLFWTTQANNQPLEDPSDPLRPYLLATVGSATAINDVNQAKAALGLPSIYIYSKGLTANGVPEDSRVQNFLQSGGAMKRTELEKMPEYFSFLDHPERHAKLFANGLSVAAAFTGAAASATTGPFFPVAALALGLAA